MFFIFQQSIWLNFRQLRLQLIIIDLKKTRCIDGEHGLIFFQKAQLINLFFLLLQKNI